MVKIGLILVLAYCCSSIWNIEGYGADLDIHYEQELLIKNEADFHVYAKYNNTLLRFAPSLTLTLSKVVMFANQANVIILGPVTITQFGIYIENCSNFIVRDIRILNASIYGILIFQSHHVLIDHCTILDASRTDITRGKGIDLTEASSNITISYNILGYTFPVEELHKFKGLLIANFYGGPVSNVSIHHNVFYCDYQRSPEISTEGLFDMRYNIIFNYTEYGSRIRNGAYGNFMGNSYIGGKKDPLVFEKDVKGIYSVANSWMYNCLEDRKIDDVTTHIEYTTPTITNSSKKTTLSNAGCLTKSRWEFLVVG